MNKNLLFLTALVVCGAQTQFNFGANGVPTFDHIVVVIEENHSLHQCLGNTSMPYFNFLVNNGALFNHSYGWGHPSEPNYIVLFSGSNYGINDDDVHPKITAPNLWSSLAALNKNYTSYCEDLPAVGSDVAESGSYARKHNPTPQFVGVPTTANQPFTSWPSQFNQLPQVSFVVPNLDNDAHDGSLAQADAWLQTHIKPYADWAKNNNSLLIVTFDENAGSELEIPTLFYGSNVKTGIYTEKISHYSILRLLQDSFGSTPYLGNVTTIASLTDCWATTTITPPPPNPDFTISAVSAPQGDLNVTFVTNNWTSKSVTIRYSINGQSTQQGTMTNSANKWTFQIANLQNQTSVTYSISYEWNGQTLQTAQQSVTYVNPTPPNTFTQSVLMLDSSTAQITFIPANASLFVDIHYTIDNGSQNNIRMNNNNNTWTITINRLQPNDKIHYSFTYEQNGPAYDTEWFDYTVTGTITPPPPPPNIQYIQTIQPLDQLNATQLNFITSASVSSVTLAYTINNGAHLMVPMKTVGGNIWVGAIPLLRCADQVSYAFTYLVTGVKTTTTPTFNYTR